MRLRNKPYNLFFIASGLLFIASLFVYTSHQAIDIQLRDAYFVIALVHIYWLLCIFLLLWRGMYAITSRFLFSQLLTWLHILLTIAGIFGFVAADFAFRNVTYSSVMGTTI